MKRVDRAALNFLDDNMVNSYLARALTNLSQAGPGDDFQNVRERAFLHFILFWAIERACGFHEDRDPEEYRPESLHVVYMLYMSDYSFEQLENVTIFDLLREFPNVYPTKDVEGIIAKDKILTSIKDTTISEYIDALAALLLPKTDEQLWAMEGPGIFYLILIIWKRRHGKPEEILDVTKFEYEIFNSITVRRAKNAINQFMTCQEFADHVRNLSLVAEFSQTDIVDFPSFELQEPLLSKIKRHGFTADGLQVFEEVGLENPGVKQYLIEYVCCLASIIGDGPDQAVSRFVNNRADNHTDFGRCMSRAIVHRLLGDDAQHERAIMSGKKLLQSLEDRSSRMLIEGEKFDKYFSFLDFDLQSHDNAGAEYEFIAGASVADLVDRLKKISQ